MIFRLGLLFSILPFSLFGFVSKDSTEAIFRFSYQLDFPTQKKPTVDEARTAIHDQLLYLFGPMSVADTYAVPKGEETIHLGPMKKDGVKSVFHVPYQYEGKIQVKKGPRTRYSVFLPRIPTQKGIYDKGVNVEGVNTCTDRHYNSFGDFWYFWNVNLRGCPLKEGVDYDRIEGTLQRIPNTVRTYPEYGRLVNPSTKEIPIVVFLGMSDESNDKDPMVSSDDNAAAYRSIRKTLIQMGFDGEVMDPKEMSRILEGHTFRRPYVEVFHKEASKANLTVTLFFGPTQINEASRAFHYFYKEANEKSSVLIYDGHSGLGGNLDLKVLQEMNGFKLHQTAKRYQIFFFNSCTSYSYYNTLYFYRKAPTSVRNRTKSLDILTNGLETSFEKDQKTNLALIRAVDQWAEGRKSIDYQDLAESMDQRNLFGINGDEDNPTRL
jgi:hypothetical protein